MRVGPAIKAKAKPVQHSEKSAKKAHGRTISHAEHTPALVTLSDIIQQDVKRTENMRLMVKSSPDDMARIYTKRRGWTHSKTLTKLCKKHSLEKVERALDKCSNIWKLQDNSGKKNLGLKKHELFKIALFIETGLKKYIKHHSAYIRKEKTHLARTIEYDRKSKRIFIHLKTHGIKHLGTGCHKEVTRSILYNAQKPELVANSVMQKAPKKELRYLKKLMAAKGLAETYAIGEHKKYHSHKKVISIIQKLYGAGSLHHHQHNPQELSKSDKLSVARDLLRGLESMHKKDIVHRDLHGCNVLLNREVDPETGKSKISAALIDLGQALKAKKAKKRAPKVEVPKRFNPPESFWRKTKHIDAKAVDVYALGLNLYHLFFGESPEWAPKEAFVKISDMTDDEKVRFRKVLKKRTYEVLDSRKKEIEKNKSKYYPLEQIILQMCAPCQRARGTASEHRKKLDVLIGEMENK